MNEDETRITSSDPRVKDPKRVAAGKRLGAISKAAKEKKARERYNRERELEAVEATDWTIPIGIGAIELVGLCYVCYKRGTPEPSKEVDPILRESEPSEGKPVPRERRTLDSFD